MGNIKITADSSCDMSKELLEKYNVGIKSFNVTVGEENFLDGVNITPDVLYQKVKETGELPKTAAVSIAEYADVFEEMTKDGNEVVHFNLSSGFSSSHQNAVIASEDFPNAYPVDSLNLSTGTALMIIKACELAEEGKSAEEIAAASKEMAPKIESSFVVDTLEYLHKGGRCSTIAALGANLLKLRPCIEVKDGKMDVGKKYRGRMMDCLLSYVKDRLEGRDDIDLSRIFITNSGGYSDEEIAKIEAEVLKYQPFKEVLKTQAGCTISSHCGSGTLGILFVRK